MPVINKHDAMPNDTKTLDECYERCKRISAFYGWLATDGLGLGIVLEIIAIYGGLWQMAIAIAVAYVALLLSITKWSKACWNRYDNIKNSTARDD